MNNYFVYVAWNNSIDLWWRKIHSEGLSESAARNRCKQENDAQQQTIYFKVFKKQLFVFKVKQDIPE